MEFFRNLFMVFHETLIASRGVAARTTESISSQTCRLVHR